VTRAVSSLAVNLNPSAGGLVVVFYGVRMIGENIIPVHTRLFIIKTLGGASGQVKGFAKNQIG